MRGSVLFIRVIMMYKLRWMLRLLSDNANENDTALKYAFF